MKRATEALIASDLGALLHSRVSVLEQQIIDQKEATALALAAADKAIINAVVVADKAVAKVELAATASALDASISSLKEAFTHQIDHQKELTAQALAAADKAVLKAEDAAQKRFESVNEFRATLSDQQRDLATKTEVNLRVGSMEDRLNRIWEEFREAKGTRLGGREAATDNRAITFSTITAVLSLAALAVAVASHLIK